MTQRIESKNRSLLNSHIEKISVLQSSIQDLQVEINEVRRDARTEGFNMEAVHILSQIVAKSSHDGGLGLLQDIVKYAQQIGVELDTVTVETNAETAETDTTSEDDAASVSHFKAIDAPIDQRFALLFQLGLGLGVAWMFIALLR